MIDWNYMLSQIATVAFDILYFGAIIGTIVIIILDNRNPVKTMAWILILLFLPIVGLVFYFFFGRSQRRERIIGQKSYDRLLKKPMAEYLAQDCSDVPYEYSRLIQLFQQIRRSFQPCLLLNLGLLLYLELIIYEDRILYLQGLYQLRYIYELHPQILIGILC